MTSVVPAAASAVLFKGGPTFVDLLIDATELRLVVTGPGMLYERLDLVTDLTPFEGRTAQRLSRLADALEGTVHCGLIGIEEAPVTVITHRAGAALQIGIGPASMYQSELHLRTRTGETLRALLCRLLSDDPGRTFVAGLYPVPATGHLEHHGGHGGQGHGDGHDGQGHGNGHGDHDHGDGHHDHGGTPHDHDHGGAGHGRP
ncbi:hypothetical protein RMN57_04605 [Kitasatospora sp. CM 4170]|uniref:Uncharacterized protein n=1 Tax=Kitasatospora aburaviensis TaxID=67265 RepID=A0ABW1ETP3_9ACTN|nr:hypothetical protein [Kitasatospora sp. CM 4170]WNM44042.1 hypothetical protein RMN57_04605 [Kitasatospora sp. CM 4170]